MSEQNGQASFPLLETDEDLLRYEADKIWGNGVAIPPDIKGIAASGGGVRSATVTLGAMQALAEKGLLEKFSYISTVSGGGYLGSALSWFWSGGPFYGKEIPQALTKFGFDENTFPFLDRSPAVINVPKGYKKLTIHEKAYKNLDYLRHHGSYLTSADHIGVAALILSLVRTVLISLVVWLPPLILIFLLVERFEIAANIWGLKICFDEDAPWYCPVLESGLPRPIYSLVLCLSAIAFIVFFAMILTLSIVKPGVKDNKVDIVKGGLFVTGGLLILFGIGMFFYWYRTAGPITTALVMMSVLLAGPAFAVGIAKFSPMNASYMLRRLFDKSSNYVVPIGITALFIGLMPKITGITYPNVLIEPGSEFAGASLLGTASLMSGIITALYGYYIKARSILPSLSGKIIAVVGSILFLYGLLLFCFISGHLIIQVQESRYLPSVLIFLLLTGLYLGFCSSVNSNGLHRFYRDRLMETFLPKANAIKRGNALKSDAADAFSLTEMWPSPRTPEAGQPYHLINAHVILTNSENAKVALRGGDNFVMSAAVIGSRSTGWMPTDKFVTANGPLTVASAMAASGAAANANAGYIGTGVTRDRFLSAVMSLLNIRLGLWITNPRAIAKRCVGRKRHSVATYYGPALWSGIFGFGYKEDNKFVELSDGGHFENLGIYELARRKVKLILAIDAEQDEPIRLSSLVSSLNRIREDFGATVIFDKDKGPERLIGRESTQYPGGVKLAHAPYIVGDISYNDGTQGILIYIKATMVKEVDFATAGYRASNPDFPHQTTADQFFDPEQFEAYKDIGRKSCALAIRELDLQTSFDRDRILAAYRAVPE